MPEVLDGVLLGETTSRGVDSSDMRSGGLPERNRRRQRLRHRARGTKNLIVTVQKFLLLCEAIISRCHSGYVKTRGLRNNIGPLFAGTAMFDAAESASALFARVIFNLDCLTLFAPSRELPHIRKATALHWFDLLNLMMFLPSRKMHSPFGLSINDKPVRWH